jgi:hypothetical protein
LRFSALSMASIFVSVLVLMYAFAAGGECRNARWAAFKTTHHCKLVEAWAGDAGTELERKDTAYLCDDGVKYWR